MADIFREVDEELKQERYTELWRRYGRYGIAVVVLCVAAMAAWKGWEAWQVSKRHAEGLSYGNAMQLLQEGKTAEATEFLGSLGQQTSSGYGILARFQQAAISARSGDAETALQLYDALSSDRNVPRSMRDLATILGGLQALGLSSIPSQALEERIAPLAEAGSHYRHMALGDSRALGTRRGRHGDCSVSLPEDRGRCRSAARHSQPGAADDEHHQGWLMRRRPE